MFHVPQGRFDAEPGRRRRAAILEQETIVAKEERVLQRAIDALIEVDAGKQQRPRAHIAQDTVERRPPKSADLVLIHENVIGAYVKLIEYCGVPAALPQHPSRMTRQDRANAGPSGARRATRQLVGPRL